MKSRKTISLVAGGAGFIGSHLCRALLDRGDEVICLDNLQTARDFNLEGLERHRDFTFLRADIVDPLPDAVMRRRDIGRIYNLACAASPPQYQADPEHTMLTSVMGTDRLLRLAEQNKARFLLTSTSEVYGDPEAHPQQEEYRGWVNCTGPRACYDEGKRAAEAMAFDFARLGRADVRVARIFNTYGPNMHPDDGRVVSNLICQTLSGRAITIYGDGSQTRSFCYVSDEVDGIYKLFMSGDCNPTNIGNPIEFTVRELAEMVLELTGSDSPIVEKPLPEDDPKVRQPDISRARSMLGWEPKVALREGLQETIRYFRELGAEQLGKRV